MRSNKLIKLLQLSLSAARIYLSAVTVIIFTVLMTAVMPLLRQLYTMAVRQNLAFVLDKDKNATFNFVFFFYCTVIFRVN